MAGDAPGSQMAEEALGAAGGGRGDGSWRRDGGSQGGGRGRSEGPGGGVRVQEDGPKFSKTKFGCKRPR